MKILIVEDEVLLANSLKTLLEKKGFTVEVAYDGETGKDYAETGVYDPVSYTHLRLNAPPQHRSLAGQYAVLERPVAGCPIQFT